MFRRKSKRHSSGAESTCACPSKLSELKKQRNKQKIEKKHISAEYADVPSEPVKKEKGSVLPTVKEVRKAYERAKKIVTLQSKSPSKPSQSAHKKEKPSEEGSVLPTQQAVKEAYKKAKKEVRVNQEQGEYLNTRPNRRTAVKVDGKKWSPAQPDNRICYCGKRNGLQDDCRRTLCQGRPECFTDPPSCRPSQGVYSLAHP
jgi:hypothetical protein